MSSLSNKAQITEATLEDRLLGAAYYLGLTAGCLGILTSIVSVALDRPFQESLWDSLIAFSILMSISCLVLHLGGMRNRGTLEQDCGPSPIWKHSAFFTVLQFFGLLILVTLGDPSSRMVLMWACFLPVMLGSSMGRLQVCQNGLMVYTYLLPWKKIKSYDWAEDGSLLIKRQEWFHFPRTVIAVPPIYRLTVEHALSQYCTPLTPD